MPGTENKNPLETQQASVPTPVMVEVKAPTKEAMVQFASILRAGGITTDLATAAIMYKLTTTFMDKGTNVTVSELGDISAKIIADPQFKTEKQEG